MTNEFQDMGKTPEELKKNILDILHFYFKAKGEYQRVLQRLEPLVLKLHKAIYRGSIGYPAFQVTDFYLNAYDEEITVQCKVYGDDYEEYTFPFDFLTKEGDLLESDIKAWADAFLEARRQQDNAEIEEIERAEFERLAKKFGVNIDNDSKS